MDLLAALQREDAQESINGFFAIERELRSLFDERFSRFGITYSQFALCALSAIHGIQPEGHEHRLCWLSISRLTSDMHHAQ